MEKIKALIMGAAGRDFHNFNVCFLPRRQTGRHNQKYKIVAFTAAQIPDIEGRKYLNIPIYSESRLAELIKKYKISEVFFSYSDISYSELMKKAALVMSSGASFCLLGPDATMLKSKKPVIAVTAVRTGCGKSPVSQEIVDYFLKKGIKIVAVRHPMAYGDLKKQVCQRFAKFSDLKKHKCTIEEREEYEPYIEKGAVVYAGVDYKKILEAAEREAEVILWDGGNNDLPFFRPDLHIVVLDAHRPNHEISYYPGEINFRMADVIIVNKVSTAPKGNLEIIKKNIRRFNPKAKVILAKSKISADKPALIKGKRVLIVEDGPTHTHGGMEHGAGYLAAIIYKAGKIINPKQYVVGSIKKIFENYPHLKDILPAMGYGAGQIKELEQTINRAPCESVISGTPIDLGGILKSNKPIVRVRYFFEEIGKPKLKDILGKFIKIVC